MKTLDEIFPADKDLVTDGVWFEIASTEDNKPVRWLVNRVDCKGFQGFRENVLKKYEYQIQHDTLDADTKAKLLIPGVAKHLLLDWENFPPEKPVAYESAVGEKMMQERSSMYVAVMQMAAKTQAFIKGKEIATVKP